MLLAGRAIVLRDLRPRLPYVNENTCWREGGKEGRKEGGSVVSCPLRCPVYPQASLMWLSVSFAVPVTVVIVLFN